MTDGRVQKLTLGKMSRNVTTERGVVPEPGETWEVAVPDDLILAVPPGALARLVGPDVAAHAPNLANVRRLRSEPMISLDVYFRREIPGLTKNITLLLESNHNLSLLDISQVWNDSSKGGTILNVVSSNSNPIIDYPNHVILDLMLSELRRFLDFKLGATTVDQSLRDDDVDYHRSHVQTNIGAELFVNQVGSWEFRPKATCGIPNLFIAGDFCQTFVDVVTVEGAVVSGLIAAEALRRRRGIGEPIEIITPDAYPAFLPAMLAAALRPAALAAKAVSVADTMIRGHFSRIFPNG